jgi:hypothetical protein
MPLHGGPAKLRQPSPSRQADPAPSTSIPKECIMWRYFDVELQIRNQINGGIPKSPESIEAWIKTNIDGTNRLEQLIETTKHEMGIDQLTQTEIEGLKESCWNSFKSDGEGVYIESRQIKAMFKEAANVIKGMMGMTAFKARVAERVFVVGEKIHLGVLEPSGSQEGVVHAMTRQGPISALKKSDYVDKPTIKFRLKVLNEKLKTKSGKFLKPEDYLQQILEAASELGLGADRSQGYGTFDVVKFEEV